MQTKLLGPINNQQGRRYANGALKIRLISLFTSNGEVYEIGTSSGAITFVDLDANGQPINPFADANAPAEEKLGAPIATPDSAANHVQWGIEFPYSEETLVWVPGGQATITIASLLEQAGVTPDDRIALSVAGLNDTTITNPTNGQVLKYQNGQWINAADDGGGGGTTTASREITASTTLTASDDTVRINSTTAAVDATLPAHGGMVGERLRIMWIAGANMARVVGTISGETNFTFLHQYESIDVEATPEGWVAVL